MTDLTVLVVTRAEDHALVFLDDMAELSGDLHARFLVAADGDKALARLDGLEGATTAVVRSHGYLESVLDDAVALCEDGWILRLDDDERVSYGMYEWLLEGHYREADHWAFPRATLYPDEQHRLAGIVDGFPAGGSLYPDLQTRLSSKEKSGGRLKIHQGSPFGTGRQAPCVIEHHKMLVRSANERIEQARLRERLQAGAGSGNFLPFHVPELGDWPTVAYADKAIA